MLMVKPRSSEHLLQALHGLGRTVQKEGVRLVVVDSVAALVRLEYTGTMVSVGLCGSLERLECTATMVNHGWSLGIPAAR
jgi:RecA/RadA recombinase